MDLFKKFMFVLSLLSLFNAAAEKALAKDIEIETSVGDEVTDPTMDR